MKVIREGVQSIINFQEISIAIKIQFIANIKIMKLSVKVCKGTKQNIKSPVVHIM